ncbi:cAMP-responsive element-binding protein-like 2 isoform X2 [Anneissia japonica]|uniref:cAMP-responsive element-binding protein-like 2 isoform X2 n=1 Tax=Anneissia japonica TaxID=1529436 RepID=UPI001425677D|nr:cAMP-responsive element-binding protein-like 2 isoform X2 [Anneissia japonica]
MTREDHPKYSIDAMDVDDQDESVKKLQTELETDKSPTVEKTKKVTKRGRRPSQIDQKLKLERSRQSARECRARKKQRYQYLDDMVANKERAIYTLREELELYKKWCLSIDRGVIPAELEKSLQSTSSQKDE